MVALNAKGGRSKMEAVLCTDGKWRPAGIAENVRTFASEEEAMEHGRQIHAAGKMTHWTFSITEEPAR